MITVYTDASGEPNNIYGYCISETNEERFIRSKFSLESVEAEFMAIIEALNSEAVRCSTQTIIYSDSESVVSLIKRRPPRRKATAVRLLLIQILNILDNMENKPSFAWIPRERNLAGIFIEDEVPKKINKNMLFKESLLR
ncbi:MAG TPA: reverse transcriptase-like protein [Nitrososphaeraceae archaeon]|nr:reverse transcriptase-like protein [Nitrososphaeraceae archaeon]